MPKFEIDVSLTTLVDAEDMGTALKEALDNAAAKGWRVRNAYINEEETKEVPKEPTVATIA